MPLSWSVEKVKYFKDNPDHLWNDEKDSEDGYRSLNSETKSLVFGTMAVGIGNIDWENCPEFYARWKVLEEYEDFYLYATYQDNSITKHFIKASNIVKHINLVTNVSYVPEKDWVDRFVKSLENRQISISTKDIKQFIKEKKQEFKDTVFDK